ncbi:class I SAM-dependent methyltransferase [Zavarzinia compransoris]|uniref:SAM-dependent methyltransferase n=1 Tax=Zavarzinia compransoris TaxID=1264899 RepID=A0A317DVC3_9PROT|nr:class I SAM-dependent methyltransferase [Zavarzinia compransoris]PWR18334.1 SAM-dependent methyltransferase [Zavarzinia compransoris]TDP43606.1 methyltransferase family protein [Zavarzinia compransoris]
MSDRRDHWEHVYSAKAETDVSWFQDVPTPSLDLLAIVGVAKGDPIIDIGGGASRLVDGLLAAGFFDVSVLDLSARALAVARDRLGEAGGDVNWITADVIGWEPRTAYAVWHDRAAFHFLTAEREQQAYVGVMKQALKIGGHAIIGTFAPDGPEKCSGLPVARHDAESLSRTFGAGFVLIDSRTHDHVTPWGSTQRFQFSTFRRDAL